MIAWPARRLFVVLALLATAVACGGGDDVESRDDGDPGAAPLGAVYLLTSWSLIRIDLAEQRAIEAYHFQMTLLRGNAVVVGQRLVYADVVRSGDAWVPTLHVLERETGVEQAPIMLDPVRTVPATNNDGEPRSFSTATNSMHIWYLPQPDLVAVGTSVSQPDTTKYRLDLLDANDLSLQRTIDLGETPGRAGRISMALDSSGSVALLLGTWRMNELLVSSDRLLSFQPAGVVIDCAASASSTPEAARLYFLCYDLGPSDAALTASMLIVDQGGMIERHRLPGKFVDPLFGVADAGRSVFVGNAGEVTVIEFDLVSPQVVAERQVSRQAGSSFVGRVKDLFLGGKVMAIAVVRQPIAVSSDGERVYFTDARRVYCLQAQNLEPGGDSEFDSVRALAAWNEHTFFAAGETTLHVIDAATCQARDSIEIPFETGGPPARIFVP